MTSDGGENRSQDGNGVRVTGKLQLVLEYDLVSFQVTIGGQPMPLSLAQMICGEGARLLEEQRRVVAAKLLRQSIVEEQHNAAIAAALRNGR